MMIEIMQHKELTWYLDTSKERIEGWKMKGGTWVYQFYIRNPPEHGTVDFDIFTAICNFAVACGLLRQIPMYGVVK